MVSHTEARQKFLEEWKTGGSMGLWNLLWSNPQCRQMTYIENMSIWQHIYNHTSIVCPSDIDCDMEAGSGTLTVPIIILLSWGVSTFHSSKSFHILVSFLYLFMIKLLGKHLLWNWIPALLKVLYGELCFLQYCNYYKLTVSMKIIIVTIFFNYSLKWKTLLNTAPGLNVVLETMAQSEID